MRSTRMAPVALLFALSACRQDSQAPTEPVAAVDVAADAASQTVAFEQVSAGGYHTCGVATTGRAYCWGWNQYGQIGDGTNANRLFPRAVAGGLRFRHVSVGDNHSCGVTTDDRVYCWGRNERGQLGDGTQSDRLTPGAAAGNRKFRQVRAGLAHTCAITPADVAFCWGENSGGRLGDGTMLRRLVPTRVVGDLKWRQLSGGGGQTCGVTMDDHAYCWGGNGNGELGDGTHTDRLQPTPVTGGLRFRQIEAGSAHTCAVTTADRAYCWGYGGAGNLGDGTQIQSRPTPRAVSGQRRFDHVNASVHHTCGVTVAGKGFCWGVNSAGEIGDGTTTPLRTTPRAIAGGLVLAQVSTGFFHTCGVTTAKRAYCWGNNIRGQIGDGTSDPSGNGRLQPVPVAAPQ